MNTRSNISRIKISGMFLCAVASNPREFNDCFQDASNIPLVIRILYEGKQLYFKSGERFRKFLVIFGILLLYVLILIEFEGVNNSYKLEAAMPSWI